MTYLLLGCGGQKIEGWIGVDINPGVNPDIVDNIITLKSIESDSVDKIKSVHSFEHLLYRDSITALINWHRVLKLGGELSIEFPDFRHCINMIVSADPVKKHFGINGLFGDIDSGKLHLMHKFAWSFLSLKDELSKIGFTDIKRAEIERINECSRRGYVRDVRLIAIKEN